MKNQKIIGLVLLVGGIVLLIVSLAADRIGIGAIPGFGFKQIGGTVLGAIAVVAGYFFYPKKK